MLACRQITCLINFFKVFIYFAVGLDPAFDAGIWWFDVRNLQKLPEIFLAVETRNKTYNFAQITTLDSSR